MHQTAATVDPAPAILPLPRTPNQTEVVMRGALGSLATFVLVLVVLKFFFGWNISILGSVVLTIILSLVFRLVNRR